MNFFRKRLFKLGNKGLSMVELICGIAILSFIGTAISGVMVISADSYKRGSAEAEVQKEAQLVANQISDLMIDATADVDYSGNKLTITQSDGSVYTITWDSATQKLFYAETVGGVTTPAQLLATGIANFNPHVSDFDTTGYATLEMDVVSGSKTYPAKYAITGRNREMHGSSVVAASIDVVPEWLMEPNETHTFTATVNGISNTAVDWTLSGSSTGSGTSIADNGTLTIGANEMSNRIYLTVATEELDGSNIPLAQKTITVYIRRVNLISVNGTHVEGEAKKAGAKYELQALVDGSMLLQLPGVYDTNYVNPYNIAWTVTTTNGATADVQPNPSDNTKATLVLTSDMPDGSEITVIATAQHPLGINKSSSGYGSATDTFTITMSSTMSSGLTPFDVGDGWLRQSNRPQATVNEANLSQLQALYCGGTGVGTLEWEYQFEDLVDGTVVGWLDNRTDYSSDASNSRTINVRPLLTAILEYDHPYRMSIKFKLRDASGNVVWPDAATDPSEYMISNVVQPVEALFEMKGIADGTVISKVPESDAPEFIVEKGQMYEILNLMDVKGVDIVGTSVVNALEFILEKKNATGAWEASSATVQNITGKCGIQFNNDGYEGDYRVKIAVKNQPDRMLQPDGSLVDRDDGLQDWVLYDDAGDLGTFYFSVLEP